MIERTEIDGKPCYVIYLTDDMEPTDKETATMRKVIAADRSSSRFEEVETEE